MQAAEAWDKSVTEHGAVWSAAGVRSDDPFIKFPEWFWPYIPESGTIVDVGCGYGRVAVPILRAKPALCLIGLDVSVEMLAQFDQITKDHGVAERAKRMLANMPPIPLDDASADLIFTSAVLLHNPHDVAREMIREMHRILKPGGKALFTASFPARWNLEGLQNYIAQVLIPSLRRKNGPARTYSRAMVREALADFEHIEIFTVNATVLPRSVWKWPMPGQKLIRRLNAVAARHDLIRFLFAREFEAVAIKAPAPR